MRAVVSTRSVLIALASILLQQAMPLGVVAAPETSQVEIPSGTQVLLALEDIVGSETAQVGQRVFLRVENPILIGDKLVIAAGARAIGEVTQASKLGIIGRPGIVGVTLRSVEAVDGTNIPISGNKIITGKDDQTTALIVTILCCVLGLLMKGGPAQIAKGSTIEATVAMATKVQIGAESGETERK